jgi:hypothetical protein
MAAQIITIDDLQEFKQELLGEIEKLLRKQVPQRNKKWIKSKQVRELLDISPGTLQNLRLNGTLPFSKVGGVILYDEEEIHNMIDSKRALPPEERHE